MATPLGLRKVKVFEGVAAGTLTTIDDRGDFVYAEVTNDNATVAYITVNIYPEGGMAGTAIPVSPGATRAIPMVMYNFKTDQPLTIVAYGL